MPRNPVRFIAVFAALVVSVAACSSSSSKSSSATPTTTPASSVASPTSAAPAANPISHVFVINLENKDYDQTWGASSPATYLNGTLVPKGVLLTQYYGIGHFSLDNYIAEISGQSPNSATQADCTTYTDFQATGTGQYQQALGKGCVYPASVQTVANQLDAAHRTWKGYMEDMGTPCRHPAVGSVDPTLIAKPNDMYATRHNPFVYFHSITDTAACAQNDVDLKQLTTDLASAATTPNLAFITPNLCNDGHDAPCKNGRPGGLTSADAFLAAWVPKILASPAYAQGGMLVITFDEAEAETSNFDASACCHTPPSPNAPQPGIKGPGGGRVGTLVLSPHSAAGSQTSTPYNHYSLLCSIEKIFGLDRLGFAGAPGLLCFGRDVYTP